MAQAVQHEFAPPAPRGLGLALLLALLAHGLLAVILTAGVQWKRSAPQVLAVEAELWAAVPTQAAPAAPLEVPEETAPATPPLPPVPAEPAPAPTPVVKTPAPDITLAKEKERLKKEELQRQELERQKQEKLKHEKEKLAKDKAEKERLEKLAKEKDRQKDSQQAKLEAAKREKEEARRLEEIRQQNLKRMAGLAASGGGTGGAKSTGTAAQSAGPSAGYAGRVRARVKPNIVFTEALSTNPTAEVEVRTSPDGTILSSRIVQSSGVKAWDEAVLKALEKTDVLPKDTDGRVPSPMIISFRPRDN